MDSRFHNLLNAGSVRSAHFRAVRIGHEDKFGSIPLQDLELLIRPIRAQRSDRIKDTDGLQTQYVRRTFDQHVHTIFDGGTSGYVDSENRLTLLVDETIGRIEVLGRFVVICHRACRVTDDAVVAVADRDHDASPEEVVILFRLLGVRDETKLDEHLIGEQLLLRIVDEPIPCIIREANAELFDELLAPAIEGIGISGTSLIVLIVDVRDIVLLNEGVSREHCLTLFVLLLLFGRTFVRIFLNGYMVLARQMTNCFRKIHVLLLLDERDGVTAFAASKTMPRIPRGINH